MKKPRGLDWRFWLAAAGVVALADGQVQVAGKYRPKASFTQLAYGINSVYSLPAIDNYQLVLQDMTDQRTHAKPYKFAEAIPVDIDMKKDGEWKIDDEGKLRTWQMLISSPGASSLGLLFEDFFLPGGGELYLIGQEHVLGAFTGTVNNKENGQFSTTPMPGDVVILEYVEPVERATAQGPARIRLDFIAHGFRGSPKDYRESGSCNIDVACGQIAKWTDQINSIAMLITDNGQRFCTGAMVNNLLKDGKQYLLTANHCIFGDMSRVIAAFNYQYRACNTQTANAEPHYQSVQGTDLLSRWDQSDFALLRLVEHIPDNYNVFLAGWDISKRAPANVVGFHHPSGDVKKISVYAGNLTAVSWMESPRKYHWEIPHWTEGITEPGSSGSPLFSQDGFIVGHLHGGQSSCLFPLGYDVYGAIAWDWGTGPAKTKRLRDWLNPQDRPVTALRGIYLTAAVRNSTSFKDDGIYFNADDDDDEARPYLGNFDVDNGLLEAFHDIAIAVQSPPPCREK